MLTQEFFSRYGVPLVLHSELLGIHETCTTPFRPQSDGQSERNIRTIIKMIAMVVDKQGEWDEYLPFIAMVYRATPHESTGYSPNFMMYGACLWM